MVRKKKGEAAPAMPDHLSALEVLTLFDGMAAAVATLATRVLRDPVVLARYSEELTELVAWSRRDGMGYFERAAHLISEHLEDNELSKPRRGEDDRRD